MAATLAELLKDGTYRKIFEKWGMEINILPEIKVNDAKSFADFMKLD